MKGTRSQVFSGTGWVLCGVLVLHSNAGSCAAAVTPSEPQSGLGCWAPSAALACRPGVERMAPTAGAQGTLASVSGT